MQTLYEQYRKLLFTLAYQLTGSVSDAEDAVQDVFLKLYDVKPERLGEPKAYLCKMVTNRCLDLLKSARKQREQYFGHWLPEPIMTQSDEPFEAVARSELLSYAILVLLERLSPSERAVFVLREAFSFEYSAIADLIGKSETNCRKLISRAREKMEITTEEPRRTEAVSEEWVQRFLSALEKGNMDVTVAMLAEDVVLLSDGGGKVLAAVHPIKSRNYVLQFLHGLMRKASSYEEGIQVKTKSINGQMGIVIQSGKNTETVVMMQVKGNLIHRLYFIRNPDKLKRCFV